MPTRPHPPARILEAALLITIIIHAAAMVSMMLLLPGLPGGLNDQVADRATYVAAHPGLWRIGWLPWQLTALSDLFLGFALVGTPWVRKTPAIVSAIVTLLAVIPDQFAQLDWTWLSGVTHAQAAVASGDFAGYARYETHTFTLTAGYGAGGYILGAIGWSICFATVVSPRTWSRGLTLHSIAVWGVFAAATSFVFIPEAIRSAPVAVMAVSIGNALAFILLLTWLLRVYELVLRRARPDTPFGGHAPWRTGRAGLLAPLINAVGNARATRQFGRLLPSLAMSSDITDVVYINYLVEADRLEPLLTPPLRLQRLGPNGRWALFTHLTYRHGCFGPTCFGPLRRFWPSPIQSNWRIYVQDPATGCAGVQFITTAITSTPHALATRLLADGVPMHIPAAAAVTRNGESVTVRIDPGSGTAPDLRAELTTSDAPPLEAPWSDCFPTWAAFLEYSVPQDRALTVDFGRTLRQEITLNIPLDSVQPLRGEVCSAAADAITGRRGLATATPLCFLVPRVSFHFGRATAEPRGTPSQPV